MPSTIFRGHEHGVDGAAVYSIQLRRAPSGIDSAGCPDGNDVGGGGPMCRSIKTLYNFHPPATDEEIRASSLQFVRKLSGSTRPSRVNEEAFTRAVDRVAEAARELLGSLVTHAPPRDRDVERSKARARAADRVRSSTRR
jgi:hypothetical protein